MTLFIVAASFEDRSYALIQSLGEREVDDEVLVLDFSGYENVGQYLYNRSKILQELRNKRFEPRKLQVDLFRPLQGIRHLKEVVTGIKFDDVVLDVSVLPKSYLFGICRLLASLRIPTRIRYYKPEIYGRVLSQGIGTVRAVPGFEGDISDTGNLYLAIVLGFEGYKALHCWEKVGPTKCIALIGDPPYQASYLDNSKKHNMDLLNTVDGIQLKKLHTYDVKIAIKQLVNINQKLDETSSDMSLVLCPLGTKLQSLACFALAYCKPQITLVTVSSRTYFSKDYSTGWDPNYTELLLQEILSWVQ